MHSTIIIREDGLTKKVDRIETRRANHLREFWEGVLQQRPKAL
jgi:hypothetical protein